MHSVLSLHLTLNTCAGDEALADFSEWRVMAQ